MDEPLPPGTSAAVAAVRDCLAAERGEPPLEWAVIPSAQQGAVIDIVTEQRVTSLVAPYAEQLGLQTAAAVALRDVCGHDVRAAMRVESAAIAIVGGLNGVGIRCLTYKGVALAMATTGDPAARGPGDLDLLVAPDDVPAAHVFLLAQGARFVEGYSPSPHSPLWPTARRLGCEMPYVWNGVDLDLHWRFDRLPQVARMTFDELWERRDVVVIGGRPLPTLGADDAMLVTCAHGTKEHWRNWRWIVDAVRQARMVSDWHGLRMRARETGCEQSLAVGLAIHEYLAPSPAPFAPGSDSRHLAARAWEHSCRGSAPFGGVSIDRQLERLSWTRRTLPSMAAGGSLALRQALTTLDMAELPLPAALVFVYPVVRPYLWARRLITGRYGPAAIR